MRDWLSEPTVRYCELPTDGFIKRPYYAISNIPFFISSFLILIEGRGSLLSKQFAFTSFLMGLLSFLYDSSYTYISQIFDLFGMMMFVNLLIYLNFKELFKARSLLLIQFIILVINMFLILSLQGYMGNIVFGGYILLVLFSEIYLVKKGVHSFFRRWVLAFSIFVFGFVLWITDVKGIFCFEFGFLNGRAIFHLLSAFVVFLLFRYYSVQKYYV